jgi:hypothetical protein
MNRLKFQKRITFLLIIIPSISFAQLSIPENYSVLTISPANGKKMEQVFIGFDNDALKDTAVLVQNQSENSTYKFILFLTSLNKSFEVDLISLQETNVYPVQIKTQKDVIEFGYYEDGTASFGRFIKVRYNSKHNKIQVIGYDVEYKSSNTERINKSYNLITGKYIVKRINYSENNIVTVQEFPGENDFFKNKVFLENLDATMLVNLDDVGSPYE